MLCLYFLSASVNLRFLLSFAVGIWLQGRLPQSANIQISVTTGCTCSDYWLQRYAFKLLIYILSQFIKFSTCTEVCCCLYFESPWVIFILFHSSLSCKLTGFGDSTGTPSEEGVVHDAYFAYKWLKSKSNNAPIFIWGHSLGTGCVFFLKFGLYNFTNYCLITRKLTYYYHLRMLFVQSILRG